MAKLNKEAYEGKREWAAKRMHDNAEIGSENGLTEDQADVLERLCRVRHELHSDMEGAWNDESASTVWQDLEDIQTAISEAGLPRLKNTWEYAPTTFDYDQQLDLHTETLAEIMKENSWSKEEALKHADDFSDDSIYFRCRSKAFVEYEEINKQLEKYLAEIDKKYGTDYCPSGTTRL